MNKPIDLKLGEWSDYMQITEMNIEDAKNFVMKVKWFE